jgi:hypothetical protein
MNELQKLNAITKEELGRVAALDRSALNIWYVEELADGNGVTQYATSSIPFSASEWNDKTKSITLKAMMDGTQVGLGGVYSIASVQKTSGYYLGLTFDGVTLSDTLRNSAEDAERLTVDAINTHIKNKTTWKRLTDELTAKRISKGDLPKYLTDLEEYAKKAGGDTVKLRRLINQANANIEKLALNGAPTKDLKKAYANVVKAVEKGDVAAMNKALQNALDKKAVYNNARIARTELSRAYSKGFKRQLMDHPEYADGNTYVQISLSSGHNVIDVCDFIAGADQYNLGEGVYPNDSAPMIPFHPNCLCLYNIVVIHDVDGRSKQFSKERGDEWMNGKSDRDKRSIEYSATHTDLRSLTALPREQVTTK